MSSMDCFTSPNHTISSAASQGDLYASCADGDLAASTNDVGDACSDVTITASQRRRRLHGCYHQGWEDEVAPLLYHRGGVEVIVVHGASECNV